MSGDHFVLPSINAKHDSCCGFFANDTLLPLSVGKGNFPKIKTIRNGQIRIKYVDQQCFRLTMANTGQIRAVGASIHPTNLMAYGAMVLEDHFSLDSISF